MQKLPAAHETARCATACGSEDSRARAYEQANARAHAAQSPQIKRRIEERRAEKEKRPTVTFVHAISLAHTAIGENAHAMLVRLPNLPSPL